MIFKKVDNFLKEQGQAFKERKERKLAEQGERLKKEIRIQKLKAEKFKYQSKSEKLRAEMKKNKGPGFFSLEPSGIARSSMFDKEKRL